MNASIALILTTAVTISTIIYTFYSIQLWRATRAAAEISRQATVSNLWAELNRYIELLRRENAPEAPLLEKLSNLLLEVMITNLIAQSVSKDNQAAAEFRRRVSALIAENEADVAKVPWITKLRSGDERAKAPKALSGAGISPEFRVSRLPRLCRTTNHVF